MRSKLYTFLSIAITVALLIWAWHDVSLTSILAKIKDVHIEWLFVGFAAYISSFCIRACRWGTLLKGQPSQGTFYIRQAAVFIGFGANQVLPANAGELIRSGILKRFAGIPIAVCIGSLLAARLLDATVAFMFLLVPLWQYTHSEISPFNGFQIIGLGGAIVFLYFAFTFAAQKPEAIASIAHKTASKAGKNKLADSIAKRIIRILSGLSVFKSYRQTAIAFLQTIGVWSISGITFWAILRAFNISELGFLEALLVQSLEAMATIIPSTPGHLGAFEAAIRLGLSLYQVSPDVIVAYTLMLRIVMNGSLILLGLIFAASLGIGNIYLPERIDHDA